MTTIVIAIIMSSTIPYSKVYANHEFAANLTGQQEVPSVDTQAIGEAIFVPIIPQNETMSYFLNGTGIQAVTQGHIHIGKQGENGDVVVTLFKFNSTQSNFIKKGNITANNLEGPLKGKTITDLLNLMKNGDTYVNFHTEKNPKGEIRGQIVDIP